MLEWEALQCAILDDGSEFIVYPYSPKQWILYRRFHDDRDSEDYGGFTTKKAAMKHADFVAGILTWVANNQEEAKRFIREEIEKDPNAFEAFKVPTPFTHEVKL